MKISHHCWLALILIILTPITHSKSFSIGLWGDMPYNKNNDGAKDGEKMLRLIQSINQSKLAFTVFDGDSKDGSSLCSDDAIGSEVHALFQRLQSPAIYVLGDNEWTDCHRLNNGGYDALERLAFLRKTFFATPYSLGQQKIKVERQPNYPENSRWRYGSVMFVGLNVTGSNNNKIEPEQCLASTSARTVEQCAASQIEYTARDAANGAFLRQSFDLAKQQQLRGLMVIIQADMGFDLPESPVVDERSLKIFNGYNSFLATLAEETTNYQGQVVLVHGDTHFFKIDKPLWSPTRLIKNFTRVETFGSPHLHWIKATIDEHNPNVFIFQPVMVNGN